MRSPRTYLLVLAALLALGNLWFTFHRSGIPAALTGRVGRVEVRPEKHPGLDDVHLVTVAGREIHLDAEVATLLAEGDEVRKSAWSTEIEVHGRTDAIGVSRDFLRMALAMPLLMALAVVLLWRRRAKRTEATLTAPLEGGLKKKL